ncbi:hypothetical protein [Halobaculum sp. P14]|uniref:hypothetical protein n=1 Tax=Halobaculum sp. P14 TaxID=3421638 RepID=UPI003EB8D6D4
MSGPPSSDQSAFGSLHRLVEHYTPDGTLGRLLLGVPALLCAPVLFLGGIATMGSAVSFVLFLIGALSLAASVPALVVGVATLWPVYLSLIGNVDSPADYPQRSAPNRQQPSSNPQAPSPAGRDDDEQGPEAELKRRYAAGDIDHHEFERRLDDLFGAGEDGRRSGVDEGAESEQESSRDKQREPER